MLTFNSNKKKIVIVADPHNDINTLDKILTKEGGDINLVLGDWFDSFVYDDPEHYKDAALYLKDKFLTNPNNYTLYGNHDLHYLYHSPILMCSGYEDWKYNAIDEVLDKDRISIRNKFHWAFVVDDILLTHAGLDCRLIKPTIKTNNEIFQYLDEQSVDAKFGLTSDDEHWFYQVGSSRGGRFRAGGIVWCDFDHEFQPIEDLRQIVGHTSQWETGRAKQHHREGFANIVDANNICIDCHMNQYITITNGKIELKDSFEL